MTVGESNEAQMVLPAKAFHLLGMFDRLREQIRERLMPSEAPVVDIPRLSERGLELGPERRFDLRPEWGPS